MFLSMSLTWRGWASAVLSRRQQGPAYHPATLLKIYFYGYLNRVQSSRRLERECQRNIELVWLTDRLMPDFKTIADFRKDNGEAIRRACREFVVLCRRLELFSEASVAIDGSKFKGVNTRDRNFTQAKMQLAQIDESIARYLSKLDSGESPGGSRTRGQDHPITALRQEIRDSILDLGAKSFIIIDSPHLVDCGRDARRYLERDVRVRRKVSLHKIFQWLSGICPMQPNDPGVPRDVRPPSRARFFYWGCPPRL